MHASAKKIRREKKKIDSLASRRVNPRGLSRPRRSAPAGSVADLNIVSDPIEAAEEAGLRYVSDGQLGYTRKAKGDDFNYFDTEGKLIRDEQRLLRIKRLAVPPAYTRVWICPSPNGHIQATGRDARGRKQYRYHERWRAVRDEAKYGRMVAFGEALPGIRSRIDKDLARSGISREKVLAAVVRLLDSTLIRVGNPEYARENNSFGLTTLRDRHVDVSGSTLRIHFRGKRGKEHHVALSDGRLAGVVKVCQDLPGQELFQYVDEDDEVRAIESSDVNDYLRAITGQEFTAKDFRTWGGTVHAAGALLEVGDFRSEDEAKRNVVQAI